MVGPRLAIGRGPACGAGGRAMGGSLRILAVGFCAAAVACARGSEVVPPPLADAGGFIGGSDGGDAGPADAGDGGIPDAGPDAGPTFGGPGPWPMHDVTY